MNRRKFIKVVGFGAAAIYLSGCGLSAIKDEDKEAAEVSAEESVSRGESMKIVVINSSPHSEEQSTSRYLAKKFVDGATSAGHEIFVFDAANEKTHPCRGCDQCGMDGACIFDDAIEEKLMPQMLRADLLVLVTPLYYFGMSAQLKTVVDRFYSRTTKLSGKKSMIMATAWNTADWTMEALKNHYETLVRYMSWQDVGQVWATGCGSRSMVERSEFGDMAYKIGAAL
ncbi:MAG: flavodoxin family protein [Selenomonadaceae bacterium]|nr:flavodoxin family protein [Selenomonadaceae bacterium]